MLLDIDPAEYFWAGKNTGGMSTPSNRVWATCPMGPLGPVCPVAEFCLRSIEVGGEGEMAGVLQCKVSILHSHTKKSEKSGEIGALRVPQWVTV